MRIEAIECISLVVPIREKYQLAGGTHDSVRSTLVKVTTNDGALGVGEAHQGVGGYSHESMETMHTVLTTFYAPAVLGEDGRNIARIMDKLNSVRIGNRFAKCALEVAIHDALGKHAGQPVNQLLGGACRKKVQLLANVGMLDRAKASELAAKRVEEGYTTIKVKVGGPDVREEISRVRAVREAVGPSIAIRVDANGAYSTLDALRLVEGLTSLDLQLIEAPVSAHNLDGMARIRQASGIPLMADEGVDSPEDTYRLFSNHLADIMKIKISKVGGFREALKIIAVAEAAGGSVLVGHGMSTSIQALSEVHLMATSPLVLEAGEMVGPLRLIEDIVEKPMVVQQGTIEVPTTPGLGVTLRDEMVDKFAVARKLFHKKKVF